MLAQNSKNLYPLIQDTINILSAEKISVVRKAKIQGLVDYIQMKIKLAEEINLNFICTHNSRRSQLAQLWAQTAAWYYDVPVNCYSGGVEETAFNERAVASIQRAGFKVTSTEGENPQYKVSFSKETDPLVMYSKLYDDSTNPSSNFAAIMTCSHADENCPLIPGAEKRIPLLYDDPKDFDGTVEEQKKYDERSRQIATELFYVFAQITKQDG